MKEERNKQQGLFRFNEETGEWKKLTVEFRQNTALLTIEQGRNGAKEETIRISLKLEMQEVAFLQALLFKGLLKSLEV
jgi:hypothetical protein